MADVRVVVDTNALFQAMLNDFAYLRGKYGSSAEYDWGIDRRSVEYAGSRLWTLLRTGVVTLALNQQIEDEVERLLVRHAASSDRRRADHFEMLRQLVREASRAESSNRITICRDPDDNGILECAVAANAQFVVTEDQDLLSLRSYDGCRIVTTVELAQLMGETDS